MTCIFTIAVVMAAGALGIVVVAAAALPLRRHHAEFTGEHMREDGR